MAFPKNSVKHIIGTHLPNSCKEAIYISKAWRYWFDTRKRLLPYWGYDFRITPFIYYACNLTKQASLRVGLIGQNVWLLNDIMENTKAKNLPGIRLTFYHVFRKASDTIERNFILDLSIFQLRPAKCWIFILNYTVESGVMNAGLMTNYFKAFRRVP